ncbi:MAG TPA: class I SAM-dependent methyltransferase [Solirubrobacterales bacterium]|nr:class I SAM-dependent methyltransferase [Solirubrobacterales bacterium]
MASSQAKARARLVYVAKAVARYLRWLPADLRRGEGKTPLPPRRLSFVGRGDFERTGNEYLGHFRRFAGLQPGDRVLDMGCGIGRMAIPLMGYLEDGSYEGFDVGRAMIRWCSREITPRRPDFRFTWAPVYNRKYNPFGTVAADGFRFPYEDASFDFVFATSLFTHLVRAETEHYLREAARVLRPGGTALLTFFLLDGRAEAEVAAGRASFDFRHPIEGGFTTDPGQPEEAIAYPVDDLRGLTSAAGFEIEEPIRFGLWSNHPGAPAGQDIVVARRVGA